MSTVSVSFPVEAHVRRYLLKRYGSAHIAGKNSLLGKLVLDAITKNYVRQDNHIGPEYKYSVLIPELYYKMYGHSINYNTAQYLGDCCTCMFNEALYEHLDAKVSEGFKAMAALRNFLASYYITEDDVKIESVYKAYQRHCNMSIKSKKPPVTKVTRRSGKKKPK
jgi:hypothetical protein